MSRKIREIVGASRTSGTQDERHREALEFISKFASVAPRFGTVDEVLQELGYKNEQDSVESETSSFSFAMQETTNVSFATKSNRKAQFSCELAHRSWSKNGADGRNETPRKDDDELLFLPWVGVAAIMFVDLSGYSRIASALTDQGGAHALSAAVNAYFEAILDIVCDKFGGDVLTFAGDAICVAWPCIERTKKDVCVLACSCAAELQRKCGMSPVQGTDLAFRLHIGVTVGEVESQVLTCRSSNAMQSAYHFVFGEPLSETAIVVDAAKIGEICATEDVREACGPLVVWNPLIVAETEVFILQQVEEEATEFIESIPYPLAPQRCEWLEKALVPPVISRKLRQGFKASHLAEMRFLCVLFVRKQLHNVSALEWFSEVQQVLDECSCPVVQLIHDDKGTHLIAAVNLFRTERDPVSNAIRASRTLLARETGCAIGVACGEVFCGITGADQACRWDVTGPACVRACRLMQHGVAHDLPIVLDEEIYKHSEDVSQLQRLPQPISMKGSPSPVTAFVLSDDTKEVTTGILSVAWSSPTLHQELRAQLINNLLSTNIQRGVAVLSGPIGAGKKTSALLALGMAKFSNVVQFASADNRPLSVLRTLADWFASYSIQSLSSLGASLKQSLADNKLTKSLNIVHQIVDEVVLQGIRFCYVIVYATLMDSASLGLIKAVIGSRPTKGDGKFHFCLTAYPLYRTRSVGELEKEIRQQTAENVKLASRLDAKQTEMMQKSVVHVKFAYPTNSESFGEAFAGVSYFQPTERSAKILLEATGGCLLFVRPLLNKLKTVSFSLDNNEDDDSATHLLPATVDGTIHVTPLGEDYLMREINWPKVAPIATSRFTELYDVLPPRLQLVLRVVASLSTTTGSSNPYHVFKIMEKLNSRVTEEMVMRDIRELVDLDILKDVDTDGGEVSYAVPAMVDVVMGLLTPDQDRMLKRHAFKLLMEFIDKDASTVVPVEHQPIFYSFAARLAKGAGDMRTYKQLLVKSWEICLDTARDGKNEELLDRMEERLFTENRRNPDFCNVEIFKNSARAPKLSNYTNNEIQRSRNKILLPHAMRFLGADFLPPMALGAISGEYQKMGWRLLNDWLNFTKEPGRVFLPEEFAPMLRVDLDAYFHALQIFEETIPQLSSNQLEAMTEHHSSLSDVETFRSLNLILPLSLKEERKLLDEILVMPRDAQQAEQSCTILMHYYYKVLLPRRCRMIHFVRTLTSIECVACEEMRCDSGAIGRAFRRFLQPYPIPDTVVHDALLDLATSGWYPRYYNINLQLIRELIFKRQQASADDFKAFLFAQKLFGEEITVR